MQRAVVWWESGVAGGDEGGAQLGSPGQCKAPYESRECPGRGAPCSEDLAGRTGAAQSRRDTAKPPGWEDAQNPAWMLSTQTHLPPVLPYEHLHVDGAQGRWANREAVCLKSPPPLAPCTISCLLYLLWKKAPVQQPQTLLQDFICVDPEEKGQGKKLSSFCASSSARKGIQAFPIPFPAQSASL